MPAPPQAPQKLVEGFLHTVEKGQTFYRISKIYGVDVSVLMRANGVEDPSQLEIGQKLFIPKKAPRHTPRIFVHEPYTQADVRRAVGGRYASSVWKTITVHHSATLKGGAKLFHKDHTRRKMGGLFYHFVIGNGSYSENGEVEVGFRWKRQIKANRPLDIQICLVGDFSRQDVSEAQMASLVHLIAVLQEQYGIPTSHIRRHEDIQGKHTECPGKRFPFFRLLSLLEEEKNRGSA